MLEVRSNETASLEGELQPSPLPRPSTAELSAEQIVLCIRIEVGVERPCRTRSGIEHVLIVDVNEPRSDKGFPHSVAGTDRHLPHPHHLEIPNARSILHRDLGKPRREDHGIVIVNGH